MVATVVQPLVPMQLGGSAGSSPAVSSATSCLVGGKCCVCVCPRSSLPCFCTAAGARGLRKAHTEQRASCPEASCWHWWCSGGLAPSARRAQPFPSLGRSSGGRQRYEPHLGQVFSREGRGRVWSGAARMHSSPAVPLCRNVLSQRRWVKSWKITADKDWR